MRTYKVRVGAGLSGKVVTIEAEAALDTVELFRQAREKLGATASTPAFFMSATVPRDVGITLPKATGTGAFQSPPVPARNEWANSRP